MIGPKGTVCRFRIFTGRALNAGWSVSDVRPLVDASRFRVRIQQSASGTSAQMQFTIENITPAPFRLPFTPVPPPEISAQPGIRVQLRGPDEQDWRDAFQRQ